MRTTIPIVFAILALLRSSCGWAAVVTTTADNGPGSLRQAIASATPGETVTFAVTGAITLTSGELLVTTNLTITGPGAKQLTVQRSAAAGTPDFRIFNIRSGTVTISGMTVSNGRADSGGAILIQARGDLSMHDLVLSGNAASIAGGAIKNIGNLTLDRAVISGNSASGSPAGRSGFGGGLDNESSIIVSNSRIDTNLAVGGANADGLGGGINNSATAMLINCTINDNTAQGSPAGGEGSGGGINNNGTITLTNCTVSGNAASGGAGGSGGAARGGGIANDFGTVNLDKCTVSGNEVAGGAGTGSASDGGGIANNCGTVTLENSTVSGNSAVPAAGNPGTGTPVSGGLFNTCGTTALNHSTVTDNSTAAGSLGCAVFNSVGSLELKNTIVAGNTASFDLFSVESDTVASGGFNLIGSTNVLISPGPKDQFNLTGAALKLGPLQDNGGPTFTHALLCGSPAIDSGDNTDAPETDQRGLPRIVNGAIDIGAYENAIPCPPAICVSKEIACMIATNLCGAFGKSATGFKVVGPEGMSLPAFCYNITVTNCGQIDLTNLVVLDDQFGDLTTNFFASRLDVFAAGTTRSFTFNTSLEKHLTNTVTASGQSVADAKMVTARDSATARVIQAGIACEVKARSQDDLDGNADDNHVRLDGNGAGHSVTFTITIRAGDAALSNVTISDPTLTALGCALPPPFSMAANSTSNFTCAVAVNCASVPAGGLLNTTTVNARVDTAAGACGLDVNGLPILVRSQCSSLVECGSSACLLSVQLTACVAPKPPPTLDCKGGAAAVTLQYTGPTINAATVVKIAGSSGASVTYKLPNLKTGDILVNASENGFSIDATEHRESQLGSQTRVTINSSYEVLNSSCPCRDDSDTNLQVCKPLCVISSSSRHSTDNKCRESELWTLLAVKDTSCNVITCPNTDECSSVLPDTPKDEACKGSIRELQLAYVGGGCSATQNSQDKDKCYRYLDEPFASPVRIRVTDSDGDKVYLDTGTPASVLLGDILDIVAGNRKDDRFARDMVICIYNSKKKLIEQVKLKSDCSRPVKLGDLYGGLKVVGMTSKDGGTVSQGATVIYTYQIRNEGSITVTNVTVMDNVLGTVAGSPIAAISPGQTVTLTERILVSETTTNSVVVTGHQGAISCSATATAVVRKAPAPCPCALGYPFPSNNPRTSIPFSESEVLRAFSPNVAGPNDTLKVWYNDEWALTLGIRRVIVKTKSGTTTTDYPITLPDSLPDSAVNPQIGSTALTGDQAGTDVSGRPMWPALFITDITANPGSRSNDWQYGGTPIAPHAIFGTWKGAVKIVDKTHNPPRVTVTPDPDGRENDRLGNSRLGQGSDLPPLGFDEKYSTVAGSKTFNEGFSFEARWNIADLVQAGIMQMGRVYRVQFMVHDGDQNKTGGDVGQNCATVALGVTFECPPPPPHHN